jgi:glutathione S-transferase
MRLFYTKRSPYARKVRIMALEKNISLELVDEDLTKKSELLLKTNPVGKIPTLVLDDGQAMMDSAVICQYLDTLHDRPVLIPRAGKERFDVLRWEAIADGLTEVGLPAYMEKIRHPQDHNAALIAGQEQAAGRILRFIDQNVDELRTLSLAPIAVASNVGWLQFRLPHLVDEQKYPHLMAWFTEFSKRPSVSSTVPVQ